MSIKYLHAIRKIMDKETKRLKEDKQKKAYWRRFGSYLSEREWATVREDYSKNEEVWQSFSYEEAISRVYRWGEDGIGGICDNHQRLCFAPTFWNGKDTVLKERLFGLTNIEGNHAEDIKEYLFYLDNTPTHSYMKCLYKYPQEAFPYQNLRDENKKRGFNDSEYELIDTGIFDQDRYFDVFIEYAKGGPDDLFIRIEVHNRGDEEAEFHLLPTLWNRNTWKWKKDAQKPLIKKISDTAFEAFIPEMGTYYLYGEKPLELLFTENETNEQKLCGSQEEGYAKDGFHTYVIEKDATAINPAMEGTKAAFYYQESIPAKGKKTFKLRLVNHSVSNPLQDLDKIFEKRKKEADLFYEEHIPQNICDDFKKIQRQAFAGMLWNKQFFHYVVEKWLEGETTSCPPMPERRHGRNEEWVHLYNEDILSTPDKWEYPAYYSWDLAFHTLPLAILDPEFAKKQLMLLTREWYMNPNGQIPAYEWNFGDVNPPVHSWATWRVYKIEQKHHKLGDVLFLEKVFQKLIMNFTWWVNRKDTKGKNIFQGGFLGLDNISIFNRSEDLPPGATLYQSDATSWMGMYCLNMLTIALELAKVNPSYEDMASKFYEHFLYISDAINYDSEDTHPLWNKEDGFYYDVLHMPNGDNFPLKVRSLVGLMPLLSVMTIEPDILDKLQGFKKRMDWFINHRSDLCERMACMEKPGQDGRKILTILNPERLKSLLTVMLDENEFLSPHGIRSLSKHHEANPYHLDLDGHHYSVDYEPGESTLNLFGGNSNWRGPVWFPINMLIIESLQKYHHYYGEDFKVEFPTGSGQMFNLWDISCKLSSRLLSLFKEDGGRRVFYGENERFQNDPYWKDHLLFHEYFHGDTGKGLGASHQTGWTGLISKLIKQLGEHGYSEKG